LSYGLSKNGWGIQTSLTTKGPYFVSFNHFYFSFLSNNQRTEQNKAKPQKQKQKAKSQSSNNSNNNKQQQQTLKTTNKKIEVGWYQNEISKCDFGISYGLYNSRKGDILYVATKGKWEIKEREEKKKRK
jgi:hypothetical protein